MISSKGLPFFLAFVLGSALAQTKVADSLTLRLQSAKGTQKVDILNQLAYEMISRDNGKAMEYCDRSVLLSSQLHDDRGLSMAYTYKGVCAYLMGEFKDGRIWLRKGLSLAIKVKDRANQGYCMLQLGNSYLDRLQLDSSRHYYEGSYAILRDSTNPRLLSKLYRSLGTLYGLASRYPLQKKYLERSLRIRELLRDKSLVADALIELASLDIKENSYQEAIRKLDSAESILQSNPEDLENLNDWRHQKALYLLKERKFDQAIVLFDSARAYYFRKSLLEKFISLQVDMAEIFSQRGEYEAALKIYYEALRVAELKGYDVEIMGIQLGLGWVNFNLGEMPQSLAYANVVLVTAQQKRMVNRIADALNLKGCILVQLNDFAKAKESLAQAMAIRQRLQDKLRMSEAMMNLGYLEEKRKNYLVAKELYNRSLVLAEFSKYYFGQAWAYLGLGSISFKTGDYVRTGGYLDLSEKFSKEINAREVLTQVFELRRDLLEAQGKLKESLLYSKLAYRLNDSLHRSELSRRFVNLQKLEEIEKRDRDINILTKDRELATGKIALQALKLKQQYFLIVAGSAGLFLLGVLTVVYGRYYNRVRKLNLVIEEKSKKLSEQYQLIERQKRELLMTNERLESEVDQRTRELTKQNLQLEQFGYMTSHNLRAPVARLLGLTQLFNGENLSDPLNKQLVEKIRKTAQDFDVTMKDMALILEVKNGVNASFSWIFLDDCFSKAKAMFGVDMEHEGLKLSTEFEKKIVYGIEPYLISIFYNLLSNSLKFRKVNGVLEVRVASRMEYKNIVIEYNDNGIGFNLNEAGEHLFKPFKKFHLHKEGRGLGLYMIKVQVEAMGGTVAIHSNPEEGFSCMMSLPGRSEVHLLNRDSVTLEG